MMNTTIPKNLSRLAWVFLCSGLGYAQVSPQRRDLTITVFKFQSKVFSSKVKIRVNPWWIGDGFGEDRGQFTQEVGSE